MNKLKNLWDEIVFQVEDFYYWQKWKFPRKTKLKIQRTLNTSLLVVVTILLIALIIGGMGTEEPQTLVTYNIDETTVYADSPEVVATVTLGKAIQEVIKTECKRQDVDINLVYAIINSGDPEDGVERIGVMKIHPDLREKYDKSYHKDVGIRESIYSNAVKGIERIKWVTENNKTIEGALMVYIYTKPQAQEMWKEGVSTTNWVESVKENMR